MFFTTLTLLACVAALVSGERVVVSEKKTNTATVASFAQDPAASGPNNVLVLSMGTAGPWGGDQPPFLFMAFVNGSTSFEMIGDATNLFTKKVAITEAAAILYVHWGLGEFCDIDGVAGFGGAWPPAFGDLVRTAFDVALSKEPFKTDQFIWAASWQQAKFQPITTGETDGHKWAEINTENNTKGFPVYSERCRSGGGKVNGLDIGEFRFKCDFTIRPDGVWFDQTAKPDLLPLVGNINADEALAKNKGCTKDKRKFALLAFLAGSSVKETINSMNVRGWQSITVGDGAEFSFVNQISLLDKDGKDTSKTFNATAQIKPVSSIVDTSKWPKFLAEARAILFTFEASRSDMMNGEQIYFDPTFGFGSDPSQGIKPSPTAPGGNDKGAASSLGAALAVASALMLAVVRW